MIWGKGNLSTSSIIHSPFNKSCRITFPRPAPARYPAAMLFHIGASRYTLSVTPGPLHHAGVPLLSACLQSSRELLIAADCPVHDRPRVLIGELARAWTYETGTPGDTAGWIDLCATVALRAIVDLNLQGGILALESLRPGESPGPAAARIGLTRNRACAVCRGDVAGGSVDCRVVAPGVVELVLYCEFCDQTQTWREAQTVAGLPSGIVLGEPVFTRGGDHAGDIATALASEV